MSRRLSLAVRLVALLGITGGLSGCVVYPTAGYSAGYYRPAPVYRPYYRPYGAWGYGYGGGYRPGWGGPRGYYGRPYW